MAERKLYNLNNIKDLKLFTKEITVNDKDTGEIKNVKTVNSAEIVTIIAYMLGMDDEPMEQYYKHHYENLLDKLRSDRNATAALLESLKMQMYLRVVLTKGYPWN
ncbi:MAG: hypothetical protein K6E53_15670 [Lachnospiraceae bacterium]|nr:hypothetical protein [Lachnospiraceae bacterium]